MKERRKYTRYERTRIISARALQIAQGSPVFIDIPKGVTKPIDIAILEWEAGVIPIDIKSTAENEEKPNNGKNKEN